ncbi:winged helix-turn-helix domain-containing protein [Shimia abyssi]|uniref:ArsR/SmtB family transcription factor n=1 Tax=Shimia abyssi TaxID=1662395 RepID=UPI000D0DBD08
MHSQSSDVKFQLADAQLDLIFKARSDCTRRRIIDNLSKRPARSLFEVCAASVAEDGIALSPQTVSQHLAVLERAGLIVIEWKGRTKAHTSSVNEMTSPRHHGLQKYKPKGSKA